MNESRKTYSKRNKGDAVLSCWVLFIVHYKHRCRMFSDEHLPSSVYLKSPEELIWTLNNLLLIFSTY